MYKSAPQTEFYTKLNQSEKYKKLIYYLIVLFSIGISVLNYNNISLPIFLNDIKEIIYLLLLISLFILSLIIDYILLPNAHNTTRCDFFDHSLHTKFIHQQESEDYYTNQELDYGFYKFGVNLFESCFFTLNIGKRMVIKKLISTSLLFLLIVPMYYFGAKNYSQIFTIIIQTFLSAYFLGGLIKLITFNSRNQKLFEDLKNIFSKSNLKESITENTPYIIKTYIDYETNKAWSYIHLSDKIYKKYNGELSSQWNNIKNKYCIK